ncbi:IclR family transcriptional regulator [Niallia sp. Krafla_26]|uniref:IclR family transcriptional regulator n=1 Tax=Niallia sp. Krafla_26 TaxID=3064703 RepID=UPI003D184488
MNKIDSTEKVSSLTNALRMLNLFTMDNPEQSLNELANQLGVGLSTAYRLSNTLIQEGFLKKDPMTKNLRLSSKILPLGQLIITSYTINEVSPPILEKLVKDTGETVHLSTIEGNHSIFLAVYECQNYVNVRSHVGKKSPIHSMSAGQTILAYQSETRINEVIENHLPKYTKTTITDPIKLKERLNFIRKNGYTINYEEMDKGVSAICAPIINSRGKVNYAVSIAGPSSRINSSTSPKLVKLVVQAAKELSKMV